MQRRLKEYLKQNAPFESEAQEALLNLFVASAYMRQKIESVCSARKISFNHYNVLRILNGAPEEGYSRAEIIERMLDRGSDVTRLMDRLEKIGLVSRCKGELDRRVSLHRITDRGRALVAAMGPEIRAIQKMFESRVPSSDLNELSRICEGIYVDPAAADK